MMVVILDTEKSRTQRDEERDIGTQDEDLEESQPLVDPSVESSKAPAPRRALSRRTRICLRIAATFFMLVLFKLVILLKTNERDLQALTSLLDMEEHLQLKQHHLHAVDIMLDPKKSEELFLSIPSTRSALSASRKYATHPHLAGSSEDLEDAKVLLELFQTQFNIPVPETEPIFSAGSHESRHATLDIPKLTRPQAWIDTYYPIMNTPLDRSLKVVGDDGSTIWSADLVEDGDPRDPEAAKYRDYVPTWHGCSFGGEAEGELVYVNYGTKEDYDKLVELGVDFKGKITIARYGGIFRGLKVKFAEELGAVGTLIYSDPRDDGAVTVENGYEPYPAGPARNPTSVQRGSVVYLSIYPGDPTTPGYPAYENATRVDGTSIPKIPSLPISWANAERLLEEIEDGARRELTGKLSSRKVKLVNHVDDKVMPIWNTMAVIPGHIRDEVVIIGNHRDAWVMGAADPTSGTVSLHEIIRGYGALLRTGWKPLRTILFASWDAEEYGLVGSTEWGEDFEDWLKKYAVAYLNVDVSVAGSRWQAAASPSLAHLVLRTAQDVPHPTQTNKTLWDARYDLGPFQGMMDKDFERTYNQGVKTTAKGANTGVTPLGSGSDFTVFLQRLGIASSDQAFASGPNDAVYHYHSIYDSQHWQEAYADPGFEKHVVLAKHLGLLALRVIDAIVLPLNTTQYTLELEDYLDVIDSISSYNSSALDLSPLRKSVKTLQKASFALDEEKVKAEKHFRDLLEKIKRIVGDCKHFTHRNYGWFENAYASLKGALGYPDKPPREGFDHSHWHHLDLFITDVFSSNSLSSDLFDKEHVFGHQSSQLEKRFPIRKFIKAAKRVQRANHKLAKFEQGFISKEGIKDREWYKHLGVAPGKNLGYGATTLPALTEAITIEKNNTLAKYEAKRLKTLIDKLAKEIEV